MTQQEYNYKIENIDPESKRKFEDMFSLIYPKFARMRYSQIELFLEHLKRVSKKDSICLGQLWEKEPIV